MGLESGRYDASDDHRIPEEMRARAHAYAFPALDDVRPLPDGHQELVDRIRLSKKVQGALTSAAHYLTAPDYEKMLKLIEDAAPKKDTPIVEDDGVVHGSHFEGDFGGESA